jgi:hypothetical protein
MLALERDNLALVRDGTGHAHAVAEPDEVQRWVRRKAFFPIRLRRRG